MDNNKKNLLLTLTDYLAWTLFLALGSFLFVTIKNNEAPGSIILGVSSAVFGIIIPYHLRRIKINEYRFLPEKKIIRTIIITLMFFVFCIFIFPSGFLGTDNTFKFFSNIPDPLTIISTFLFLLFSAAVYGFIFWGGLLYAVKNNSNKIIALLTTSVLFSLYHFSQFPFTPVTFPFLAWMFIWAVMLTALTLINNCVLPTIIVHQFGQFVYFASSKENPFTEIKSSITSFALLGLLL
ncbi:MAG: CPBP family intramembrane metalloprotease [Spirochaetes bacterium]|nr:CPBP family intramembrane metalloprotease [Spirochaetota bacterium]